MGHSVEGYHYFRFGVTSIIDIAKCTLAMIVIAKVEIRAVI